MPDGEHDEAEADAALQAAYRRCPQERWIIEVGLAMAMATLPPWPYSEDEPAGVSSPGPGG